MTIATPTASDVRNVFVTTATDTVIDGFIADAVLAVESCSSIAGYSEAKQKAIVKYVAAHLMTLAGLAVGSSKGQVVSEKVGDASVTYANNASAAGGEGLRATTFGQSAIALDASGCLRNLGRAKTMLKNLGAVE